MGKHIADQPRNRAEGTRIREFARIEREQGAGGPHAATATLQRRSAERVAEGHRASEFLRRERAGQE